MKERLYKIFVNNRVMKFIGSPALGILVPPVLGLYYGTLDIWGGEWAIVKDFKEVHEFVFTITAAATVLILFLRAVSEALQGQVQRKYQAILQATMIFINELVKKKKDRFHNSAKDIKPKGDAFRIITQPQDQLEFLIDGTRRLLRDAFVIDYKNVEITIIQGSHTEGKWWYLLQTDKQRQHTKAKAIIDGQSTAKYCLDTGDSLLVPDIRKGEKEKVFLPSARSQKAALGSIYCKPVRVLVGGKEYVYVFTVCVYGELICTPYDALECKACERLLDEVAERVELELCLHSIKSFKESGGH